MKISLILLALVVCFGVSHALDMSSIINGMLDNAISEASENAGDDEEEKEEEEDDDEAEEEKEAVDDNGSDTSVISNTDDMGTSGSGSSSTSGKTGSTSSSSSSRRRKKKKTKRPKTSSSSGGNQQKGDGGFMSQLGGQAMEHILPALKDFVVNAANSFFDSLFGDQFNRNYHDDIIMHRAVRVYKTGETSVVILDRTTGLKVGADGDTIEEAIETATKQLISTLLQTGAMSLLDLGLPEPTKPPVEYCVDQYGGKYCRDMKKRGFCQPGHQMATFARDYCHKTCTGC